MTRDNDDPRSPMRQFADFLKREGAENFGAVQALEFHTAASITRLANDTFKQAPRGMKFRDWLKLWMECR
jgi:hypothetical protein